MTTTHGAEETSAAGCIPLVPIFSGLDDAAQDQVATIARPTRLARGEAAYTAGADVSQLMVVHRGRVSITRPTPSGRDQIVRVLGPGEFVGEHAFLTGEHPDHHAVALDDAVLCVFRHADLAGLIARHPSIGLSMLAAVSGRLAETEERLTAVATSGVDARLAGYLLSLAPEAESGAEVRLPLAKKDVASLIGTTPESFSRALARFATRGLLTELSARDLRLTDVAGLSAVADGRT